MKPSLWTEAQFIDSADQRSFSPHFSQEGEHGRFRVETGFSQRWREPRKAVERVFASAGRRIASWHGPARYKNARGADTPTLAPFFRSEISWRPPSTGKNVVQTRIGIGYTLS
jgi:hypothetical protein